jgi:hypothetical protein
MWHSQYAIGRSWFGDDSACSVLQHSGPTGLILSLLLDNGIVLKSLLTTALLLTMILFLPLLDFGMNRMLVSSTIWMNWPQWARIVHAALPLKLLLGQMAFKFAANSFGKVEQKVKDSLVELECANLEVTLPLTVGPGSEVMEEDEEDDVDDDDDDDIDIVLDDDDDDDIGIIFDEDDDDAIDDLIAGLVGDDDSDFEFDGEDD